MWHYQGPTAGVWQESRLIPSRDHRMLIALMLGKPLELFNRALSKVRWPWLTFLTLTQEKGTGLSTFEPVGFNANWTQALGRRKQNSPNQKCLQQACEAFAWSLT